MADAAALTPAIREQLLVYLGDRLQMGEVLITADQFAAAVEEGFVPLVGGEVDDQLRQQLIEFLTAANVEDPSQLLAPGVENLVSLSVLAQVRKAGWGITEVQEQGNQLIRDFIRTDRAKALLEQLGVKTQLVNMSNCHRFVVNLIAGRQDDTQKNASRPCWQRRWTFWMRPKRRRESNPRRPPAHNCARPRWGNWSPTSTTTSLSAASRLRMLRGCASHTRLTRPYAAAKSTRRKGSKIRNSIMSWQARDRVEKHVKEALDFTAAYAQVFQALGRIDEQFDPGLRFLVRHGVPINEDAEEGVPVGLGPVVEALMTDSEALRPLIDLMDRKEAEVRMIAARLPPYSTIVKRDQGRVERVAVEEDLISELRTQSVTDLTEQLHSSDRKQRARPAAAMLSLTVLINRLIKPTPFRKELRLLKINLIIEEFYHATEDVEQARQRATDFLRGRLRSLYPDMSREETEELQRRGAELVQRVEDRVLAERAARSKPQTSGDGGEEDDEDTLTDEDRALGVQIQHVSVRITGRVRQIRYRIMPDPKDAERFVIGRRDHESGTMVPVLRRGAPRIVERGRDGSWTLAKE